jgi:hypothetical protein
LITVDVKIREGGVFGSAGFVVTPLGREGFLTGGLVVLSLDVFVFWV